MTVPPGSELAGARDRPTHWAESLARLLDDGVGIPGTTLRFGLDPILGLVAPGVGDVLTGLANVALVVLAVRQGVPLPIVARMVVNVLVDVLVGILPIAGDAFDFMWKATRRNLDLIEAHRSGKAAGARDYAALVLLVAVLLSVLVLPMALFITVIAWLFSR